MITFLAYAGSRAGERFVASVTSDLGWKVLVLGALLTTVAAVAIAFVGRSGAQDQLAAVGGDARRRADPAGGARLRQRPDRLRPRVGLGYAMVYPAAMIAKILLAQVIAGL